MKINSYLFLPKVKEAINYYQQIFDIKVDFLIPFNEDILKQRLANIPKDFDYENSCMHASVLINNSLVYMSDSFEKLNFGNMVNLSLNFTKDEKAKELYDKALSFGFEIIMSFEKQFWNANFAIIKDKYGIIWQINQNLEN